MWKWPIAFDDQFDVRPRLGVVRFIFDISGFRVAHASVHALWSGILHDAVGVPFLRACDSGDVQASICSSLFLSLGELPLAPQSKGEHVCKAHGQDV